MPEFAGRVLDDTGNAVNGASVNLFATGTTTPSVASDTTDTSGDWSISHATRGRFDVKITNGTDVVWLSAGDKFQVDKLQAESATDAPVVATQVEDAASVQVAIFEGDRATPADGDLAYISLNLSDDAGNQDEQARIGWEATTVANGATQDGDLVLSVLVNGSLTEMVRLDGSGGSLTVDADLDFTGPQEISTSSGALTLNPTTDVLVANGKGVVIGHTAQITTSSATELQVSGTAAADSSGLFSRFSADASGPSVQFLKSRNAAIGSSTVVQNSDVLGEIVWFADDGTDFATSGARIQAVVTGTPGGNDMPTALLFETTGDGSASASERLRITSTGSVLINETSNANMTIGLTLNQGANDDQILAGKSSDVAHALTTGSGVNHQTDDYFSFRKLSATEGGLRFVALAEDGGTSAQVLQLAAYGATANTAKTTQAQGLITLFTSEHDGANALADITADGNVFVIQCRKAGANPAVFLVDEDGDFFYDGADGGAFDAHDDLSLVRAFDRVTSPASVIEDEWDGFVRHNEDDLVRLGILGAPVSEGGLVNGAQLQRLHNGSIWQLAKRVMSLESKLAALPAGGA